MSDMVRPLVNLPVGRPPDGLKSIPYGGELAFERVKKWSLFPASTSESPKTKEVKERQGVTILMERTMNTINGKCP